MAFWEDRSVPHPTATSNMHLTEFTTTGLKKVNTEFKLYTIGHNLKRIYNEINNRNNWVLMI